MTDKPSGIEFDRQVFVQPQASPQNAPMKLGPIVLGLAAIACIGFLAAELVPRVSKGPAVTPDPGLADISTRLTVIENRLDHLEAGRKVAAVTPAPKPSEGAAPSTPSPRAVYRITPAPRESTGAMSASNPDSGVIAQRLSSVQQGLDTLQNNESENQDAWTATTDRLADMAGQVGAQSVQILRSQDELNQLLSRTEMEPIPFELTRGSSPQPIGPVSIVLKSTDAKGQRYTLCVYFQPSCIQLKDRVLREVVQFATTRNSAPLEVVATKITKDEVLGYLEVPRTQAQQQ